MRLLRSCVRDRRESTGGAKDAAGANLIGWVCGAALGYNFILRDLLAWALTACWPTVALPPALQMDQLMTVLLGLLGLGTLRTVEKIGRVAR